MKALYRDEAQPFRAVVPTSTGRGVNKQRVRRGDTMMAQSANGQLLTMRLNMVKGCHNVQQKLKLL